MLRPVYRQGPPVASQTWSISILVSRARSVLANFRLIRSSPATRSRKLPTTAVIASIPPRRSSSESAMDPTSTVSVAQRHRGRVAPPHLAPPHRHAPSRPRLEHTAKRALAPPPLPALPRAP